MALRHSKWVDITIFTIFEDPFPLVPLDGKRAVSTCPQHSGSMVY